LNKKNNKTEQRRFFIAVVQTPTPPNPTRKTLLVLSACLLSFLFEI